MNSDLFAEQTEPSPEHQQEGKRSENHAATTPYGGQDPSEGPLGADTETGDQKERESTTLNDCETKNTPSGCISDTNGSTQHHHRVGQNLNPQIFLAEGEDNGEDDGTSMGKGTAGSSSQRFNIDVASSRKYKEWSNKDYATSSGRSYTSKFVKSKRMTTSQLATKKVSAFL